MKLEILIPQYRETEEIIKPLLDSIAIQQNVDFDEIGIIICNDGTDVRLSTDFLNKYNFNIKYIISAEHMGVSGTRNKCLDNATADYVMFCDADDMFYNACGLYLVFKEMESGFDSLTSVFVEETRNPETKEPVYINHEMDTTFVHGKIHRRQYLLDNNIRWNESLTIHEDSYFNILCKSLAKNFKYMPASFYLWKWRDASVCRHDPKYMLKTYNNMLNSNTALINEFLVRENKEAAKFYVTSMIFDAYYTLNKDEWWNDENKEYKASVENRFGEYYLKFRGLFEETADDLKKQIIAGVKNRMYGEGLFLEKITFNDWIEKIKNIPEVE